MSNIRRAQTVAHNPSSSNISPYRNRADSNHSQTSSPQQRVADDSPASTQPTTRRRRDLLKNYYGIQDNESATSSTDNTSSGGSASGSQPKLSQSPWAKRSDPLNPDLEAYHPELAYNMMVKELGLKELIRKDNDLVNEIKELDGNMKTLVYGNYSRFISATDTIRKMKSSAEDMETQIALLEQNVAAISTSAESLHAGFSAQRSKIHQLSGVSNLIKKLHFVFELPAKLQSCVKKRQYAQAVIVYSKTSALLEHYSHSPVFKQINQECTTILTDVSKRSVDKILAKKWSKPSEITEAVGIIVGAGIHPAQDVISAFIDAMDTELHRLLESSRNQLFGSTVGSTSTTNTKLDSVSTRNGTNIVTPEKLGQINRTFLGELASFVDSFTAFFLDARSVHTKMATSEIPFYSSANLEGLKSHVFARSIPEDRRNKAREDLKSFLEKIERAYFELIHQALKLPDDITQIGPATFITTLDTLKQDVSQYTPILDVTTISQRFSNLTILILDKIISGVFLGVKREFFVKLQEIDTIEIDVFTATRQLIGWIKEALIVTALPVLEKFVASDEKSSSLTAQKKKDMLERIRVTLFQFWSDLSEDMIGTNLQAGPPLEPIHILILSRLALEWSRGAIESIFSMYSQRIFGTAHMDVELGFENGAKRTRGPSADVNMPDEIMRSGRDVADNYKRTGEVLLRKYSLIQINKTTIAIRQHMAQLAQSKPVGDVASYVWTEFLTDLEQIERQVAKAFEEDNENGKRRVDNSKSKLKNVHSKSGNLRGSLSASYLPPGATGQSSGNGAMGRSTGLPSKISNINTNFVSGGLGRDALLANIDKLFQERPEFLQSKLDLSRTAVMNAITRTILKTWMEELRFCVLSAEGYAQVQTDIQFWNDHIWSFLPDDNMFQSFIAEISTLAYSRCIDPPPPSSI